EILLLDEPTFGVDPVSRRDLWLIVHEMVGRGVTAIVSTAYFIRKNDVEDAFKISEILINDKEESIHKATGWMLRFAGDKDRARLLQFLDRYAATMPRTTLRNAIEHFDSKQRNHYLNVRKGART
ncbi:DNA alkylation repair protein, partial [bacterium]|nr:DNA alkylation repair protein [bacterium]